MVYDSLSIIYRNQKQREKCAINLLDFSIDMFKNAYIINNFQQLKSMLNNPINGVNKSYHNELMIFSKNNLIDSIRICICFENYMKIKLLLRGYLVHKIERRRYERLFSQLNNINDQPIRISELKKIENYYYDDTTNLKILRGLTERTISFNTLLNENYTNIIPLPINIKEIVKRINNERNQLHFPIYDITIYNQQKVEDYIQLIKYVNNKIIKKLYLFSS